MMQTIKAGINKNDRDMNGKIQLKQRYKKNDDNNNYLCVFLRAKYVERIKEEDIQIQSWRKMHFRHIKVFFVCFVFTPNEIPNITLHNNYQMYRITKTNSDRSFGYYFYFCLSSQPVFPSDVNSNMKKNKEI